jgi:hypothetical protein
MKNPLFVMRKAFQKDFISARLPVVRKNSVRPKTSAH